MFVFLLGLFLNDGARHPGAVLIKDSGTKVSLLDTHNKSDRIQGGTNDQSPWPIWWHWQHVLTFSQ